MSYQQEVYERFAKFRKPAEFPIYPPYHKGPYLEEYFSKRFAEESPVTDKIFIPVYWTHCYNDGYESEELKGAIEELDPSRSYFAVMTHDDAPRELLPKDTMCFSAGGLKGDIPIPLICSGFEDIVPREKDVFCSFVGSITHPIRSLMCRSLPLDAAKYQVYVKSWTPHITEQEESGFREVMQDSIFSLCPRGYGPTSYRLYEALQLGSIPVYIYDKTWLPWQNELNWSEICILIHQSKISEIDLILSSIPQKRIEQMQQKMASVYDDNFTFDATYKKILERI